ncbi:MAG: hypothetical protein IPM64_08735 [Phycisphaerales bacterium]|nr:hypothetical protein [Phycisphaerales bacterium]
MESFEVLRDAIERVGVKTLAAKLKVSAALVYKWCQPPPRNQSDGSGARNPLDRLHLVYRETHDRGIVEWLCRKAGGYFVANPSVEPHARDAELLGGTQRLVQQFSSLLGEVSRSIGNDGRITASEAESIRRAWDALKGHTERFVVSCERGLYDGPGAPTPDSAP